VDEYERRFEAAAEELNSTGIWKLNAVPPYTRFLQKIGLAPRPPHYLNFWRVVVGMGVWYACAWGLMMYVWQWRDQGMHIGVVVFLAVIGGAFFGLLMAAYYRKGQRKHNLTSWDDL